MSDTVASSKSKPRRRSSDPNALEFFPLPRTVRGYSQEKFRGDAIAALNVALLAFPQGMAYAVIAGLPLSYGIFGSAVASIIGMFFAGSKFIVLGPTNATAAMVFTSFATLGLTGSQAVSQLPLLILLVGIILVIGAYARIANLIRYISRTVITGYITAAAVLIIANQLRRTLGFDLLPAEKKDASIFIYAFYYTARHILETEWPSLVLSLATFAIFYLLNRYFKALPNVAITLLLSSLLAFVAAQQVPGFEVDLLKEIKASDWGFSFPSVSYDSIDVLLKPAVAIALLCVLEGNSIGKSLAAREGDRLNSNQEMLSAGMANIGCSLLSGMAASGSLTRSQLNANSGAQTPLSSFYSGLIVLAGAILLGSYIKYIPSASLGVVVITIGISLLNRHQIRMVTKTTMSDRITFFVTFITGLVRPLDEAIYVGTACSIALFIKKVAAPEIVEYKFDKEGQLGKLEDKEKRNDPEVSIVHVEGELFFGAAELFRNQMRRVCEDPNLKVVVMKLRNAHNLDATSCMALEELIKYMNEQERALLVSEVRPDTMRILANSDLDAVIGEDNIFPDEESNPTLSTAKALKRAKEIIGDREARVSIYAKDKR